MKKCGLLLCSFLCLLNIANANDQPQAANSPIKMTLIGEITEQGQKISGIALEYEDNILSGSNLRQLYQVQTQLDQQAPISRTVLKAYVNNQAQKSHQSNAGKFVIIELDTQDKNAIPYNLREENTQPMTFKAKDKNGEIVLVEKIQRAKVPQYYNDRLIYQVEQTGLLKLTNGKTLDKTSIKSATQKTIHTPYLDEFIAKTVKGNPAENQLAYRFYRPQLNANQTYPLTLFLHGSGQVGKDNLAHLLSSKGAIATLTYEAGFVLAPQYQTVFDPFAPQDGIHWQTDNRLDLVLKMIDHTLKNEPQIDPSRIYLIGLSRGAEGALKLLQKRPHFFAGALLMSGREANTLEWIDGNANIANLSMLKNENIWFFHSKEDKVSPVRGSRINYAILHDQLNAKNVHYTEFTMQQAGDNGIVNANPHNTWDAVFNSPEVIQWLLHQRRTTNEEKTK
ncbi:phospholipase [Avibacterium volantium]|uniref:Predicted esterase n=1 Tax=Avibacterium volantium TaxID=762 RepID=A0A447SND2_AVIVO|nr:phospholipase [Avibacterium volantium]VEB22232.1 Predicted esterase [Avibacterium volantium]